MKNTSTQTRPIIYISGWMGNGIQSATYIWLQQYFTNLDCIASGGNVDISGLRKELEEKLQKNPNALIVANSYGCFLSSFFLHEALWINPCLYPADTIPPIWPECTREDIELWLRQQKERDAIQAKNSDRYLYIPVESDSDEIIPDHKVSNFTSILPMIVPGGIHKLTNEERDLYVKPILDKVLF